MNGTLGYQCGAPTIKGNAKMVRTETLYSHMASERLSISRDADSTSRCLPAVAPVHPVGIDEMRRWCARFQCVVVP